MIRALGVALLALAALLGGEGIWIHLKAELAQLLLADAWRRAIAGDAQPRPWPWADTWPVARLEVPRLDVERIVLAGASGATLAFGPGLVDGTPLPGEEGNSIVAGHRDTSFRFLARLRPGDLIVAERPGTSPAFFRVERARVVDAADPWAIEPESTPTLTLATCYPFDSPFPGGRLRYAVRARRVDVEREAAFGSGAGDAAAERLLVERHELGLVLQRLADREQEALLGQQTGRGLQHAERDDVLDPRLAELGGDPGERHADRAAAGTERRRLGDDRRVVDQEAARHDHGRELLDARRIEGDHHVRPRRGR